jgi:hypothetical protein
MENNKIKQPQNFTPTKDELSEVAAFLSTFFSPKFALHNPENGELLARGKRQDDHSKQSNTDNN